jgi:hypothetical protein
VHVLQGASTKLLTPQFHDWTADKAYFFRYIA